MAEITRLSVEKALNKLRRADAPNSESTQLADKMDALGDEIKRLRAQRLRLERNKRHSTEAD